MSAVGMYTLDYLIDERDINDAWTSNVAVLSWVPGNGLELNIDFNQYVELLPTIACMV